MDEIYMGLRAQAVQDRVRGCSHFQLVPAHVRNLERRVGRLEPAGHGGPPVRAGVVRRRVPRVVRGVGGQHRRAAQQTGRGIPAEVLLGQPRQRPGSGAFACLDAEFDQGLGAEEIQPPLTVDYWQCLRQVVSGAEPV